MQIRESLRFFTSELEKFKLSVRDLGERLEQLNRLQAEKDKRAARQVLYNVNKKILQCVVNATGIPSKEFWRRYRVCNFGAIELYADLLAVWPKVLDTLGLDSNMDPRTLWRQLKFGKQGLDQCVYTSLDKTSFDRLSYEELKARADSIFSDNLERSKDTFLDFLDLSVKLGGDLYDCR
ncbi:hypothetical protein GPECTOR_71g584 [Gonium pectorale]|uniref:Uncharacterized protein n=1 Tax=Gonium pectorale TaxID=33097 RepID=A0A150G331_GONPE|nr:hypothetical protein GPECTOR_71g584 [Gonium pectorale]|eukprot:KXZ44223.1 hypothetical protein GPECTOR_71g584 [Gonium pectorale]